MTNSENVEALKQQIQDSLVELNRLLVEAGNAGVRFEISESMSVGDQRQIVRITPLN